jgi:hypothetical protein
MKKTLSVIVALVLCICLIGCSVSQITTTLNVVSLAVSVASVTVAGTSGIDPAIKAEVVNYLSATSAALSTAAKEMKSGKITAVQIAQIGATLSAALLPALPDSVPAAVRSAVAAVTAGVQAFLVQLNAMLGDSALRKGSAGATYQLRLSHKDQRVLNSALRLLEQADEKLAEVK